MQGVRTVCDMVPQTREITVNVCTYRQQQMQGTQTVCDVVPQTRQVTVNVCTYQPVQKQGTRKRLVADTVTETVQVQECYTEMVPYTATVRVPVATAPVMASGCGDCGMVMACGASAGCCGHSHGRRGCR
jgi:hypothetical protein